MTRPALACLLFLLAPALADDRPKAPPEGEKLSFQEIAAGQLRGRTELAEAQGLQVYDRHATWVREHLPEPAVLKAEVGLLFYTPGRLSAGYGVRFVSIERSRVSWDAWQKRWQSGFTVRVELVPPKERKDGTDAPFALVRTDMQYGDWVAQWQVAYPPLGFGRLEWFDTKGMAVELFDTGAMRLRARDPSRAPGNLPERIAVLLTRLAPSRFVNRGDRTLLVIGPKPLRLVYAAEDVIQDPTLRALETELRAVLETHERDGKPQERTVRGTLQGGGRTAVTIKSGDDRYHVRRWDPRLDSSSRDWESAFAVMASVKVEACAARGLVEWIGPHDAMLTPGAILEPREDDYWVTAQGGRDAVDLPVQVRGARGPLTAEGRRDLLAGFAGRTVLVRGWLAESARKLHVEALHVRSPHWLQLTTEPSGLVRLGERIPGDALYAVEIRGEAALVHVDSSAHPALRGWTFFGVDGVAVREDERAQKGMVDRVPGQ